VITADHGVTDSGGHGGASPRETDVPLFAFGPGLVPGARLSLHQIDLAPTLSCLLGLPIPEGSLGRPAVEALAESDTARTARLDAGLTGIRQSWGELVSSPRVAAALAANDAGGISARVGSYEAVLAAFVASAARARYPLAGWALVLFVLLLARERGAASVSRAASRALPALLLAALAFGFVGSASGSLLAAGLLLLAASVALLGLSAANHLANAPPGSPRDEAPLLAWVFAAGIAAAAAFGRDHQRRATTLMFGSPAKWELLVAGLLLGLGLGALQKWGQSVPAHRRLESRRWLAPFLCVIVVEGGDPAMVAGAGVVLGALLVRASRVRLWLGIAAQAALVLLLLNAMLWRRLAHAGAAVGAAGAGIALGCLYLQRPTGRFPARALASSAALPVAVLALASLRSSRLGEGAVGVAILLGLIGVLWFRLASRSPGAAWSGLATLIAMWLVLSTPAQRVVIGLAIAALFGVLRADEDADGPPAASRLLWLAFVVTAWRWSLVGLFEGEFGFGGLEISLAYVGNPERHVVQGALTIVLKAWLPLAVALGAANRGETKGLDVKSLAQALGFVLGLRAVHLALGIAASPSSFYSVYRLLGELVYEVGLLAGVAVAATLARGRAIGRWST